MVWKPSESGTASYTVNYDYLPNKPLVSRLDHPTGVAFEYGYDTQDQLEEIRFAGVTQPLVDNIQYTPWGAVERVERSNGIDTDIDYGPGFRPWHISDVTGVQAVEMLYDKRGGLAQLLGRRDQHGGASIANHRFQYTDLGQLASTNDADFWFHLTDHHGTTNLVLDETGTVIHEAELDVIADPRTPSC